MRTSEARITKLERVAPPGLPTLIVYEDQDGRISNDAGETVNIADYAGKYTVIVYGVEFAGL